jgi:hypothetical protein
MLRRLLSNWRKSKDVAHWELMKLDMIDLANDI